MSSTGRREVDLLRHMQAELATVRCDGEPVMARVIEPAHDLFGGELLFSHRPVRTFTGWDVEDAHADRRSRPLLEQYAACLSSIPDEYAWFRPSAPVPAQRNRVVEALSAVRHARPGFFEQTPLYCKFMKPNGLHEHYQLRVLVCDGAELLAWFGIFYSAPPTTRQKRLLASLVPALGKRMRLERALSRARVANAAIAAAIDTLSQPAYVVDRRRHIEYANASGRALLASNANGCGDVDTFELGQGAQLKIARRVVSLECRARAAAKRWTLTPRQADVLVGVVAGHANATVAELLGITSRAVEHHVTAIFKRAGITNRVELVTRIASEDG